ncbi:MAG TPA: alpha/beta fold hydrolase [Solirubrobacteraceae bacterium]|nr:alpha/beta fold hydrolase [Solirubrobacteraceae bacterium]
MPALITTGVDPGHGEQSRAVYPDRVGMVDRDGVSVYWESYGSGQPAILFVPPWSIVHSRCWKQQIADFARRHQVVTFDPRGNGRSSRPADPAAYAEDAFAADALAVMDAAGVPEAVVVALSLGAQRALILAAEHPERVCGLVLVAPLLDVGLQPSEERKASGGFTVDLGIDRGWARYNAHSWRRDYLGFAQFFFDQVFIEPHSTKQIEDCVGWALETNAETLITAEVPELDAARVRRLGAAVHCPVLVVHGDADAIIPHAVGARAAQLCGGELLTLEGSGHCPQARDPVRFNHALRQFIGRAGPPQTRWQRGRARTRRALYVSSPIGLGHARRDVAIADRLRERHPDLEIEWLAQHPVTAVLEQRGERIHPASAELASESSHIEAEAGAEAHDLHCFQALRRMDEILVANFMIFHDVVRDGRYDVWIGDEAWDVDYFLHENPELKSAAYVWLTDFVGYLPMEDGGEPELALCADYNAEMIEHIARYPRVRDRAIFVGEPQDIVPETFGPGLPDIRTWTEAHYSFAGYVMGSETTRLTDRAAVRDELGYGPEERVCVVTVGGSGVGAALLRRVIDSYGLARQLVPELRMIVVAGPRIDPAGLPNGDGLEVRAYVPELHRHLAVSDLAIIQGGLATAMELTANRRPFLYFPLRHHFEQCHHVHHRLARHRAGRRMDFGAATPEVIAHAIADEIGREVDYLPVPADGAARAAELISPLLG